MRLIWRLGEGSAKSAAKADSQMTDLVLVASFEKTNRRVVNQDVTSQDTDLKLSVQHDLRHALFFCQLHLQLQAQPGQQLIPAETIQNESRA